MLRANTRACYAPRARMLREVGTIPRGALSAAGRLLELRATRFCNRPGSEEVTEFLERCSWHVRRFTATGLKRTCACSVPKTTPHIRILCVHDSVEALHFLRGRRPRAWHTNIAGSAHGLTCRSLNHGLFWQMFSKTPCMWQPHLPTARTPRECGGFPGAPAQVARLCQALQTHKQNKEQDFDFEFAMFATYAAGASKAPERCDPMEKTGEEETPTFKPFFCDKDTTSVGPCHTAFVSHLPTRLACFRQLLHAQSVLRHVRRVAPLFFSSRPKARVCGTGDYAARASPELYRLGSRRFTPINQLLFTSQSTLNNLD